MKALIGAGLLGVLLQVPVAHAHPDHHYLGGCSLAAANDGTPYWTFGGEPVWIGTIMAAAVATTADEVPVPDPLAPVDVACTLEINGQPLDQPRVDATGTGAAANAAPVSFVADLADVVRLCATVTVSGERHESCAEATVAHTPDEVRNAEGTALNTLSHIVCPYLKLLHPGVPGVVEVTDDGDVYVAGGYAYDCPPHDELSPSRQAVMYAAAG
jgi:hypothetical protein